ncbi:uncharacterized protein LOC136080218 [Hydra vulgaris]|uniref:Uncharacterized protein LOC136080218 n=1 Tax=Hydra vulgaris TaxID=6087 RepID=A0ABM4BUN9_HYDVU
MGTMKKCLKVFLIRFEKKRLANKNKILSNSNNTISLPWIPITSPRLKRIFRKTVYKTVFKSNANLKALLTSKNKSKLPRNSQLGTYLIKCKCSKVYVGELKLKIRTRVQQHQKFLTEGKLNQSALALHKVNCDEDIEWDKAETLKVEDKKFERKVREALEIQKHQCSPKCGGTNLDNRQNVIKICGLHFFHT